ncbi:hypothetical protein Stsp02_32580 [Streptomyces sp. NBRC 14336]|nr:hypothetical protein Stsp02_32580 [Streptomyces sp. NBRC 14336]
MPEIPPIYICAPCSCSCCGCWGGVRPGSQFEPSVSQEYGHDLADVGGSDQFDSALQRACIDQVECGVSFWLDDAIKGWLKSQLIGEVVYDGFEMSASTQSRERGTAVGRLRRNEIPDSVHGIYAITYINPQFEQICFEDGFLPCSGAPIDQPWPIKAIDADRFGDPAYSYRALKGGSWTMVISACGTRGIKVEKVAVARINGVQEDWKLFLDYLRPDAWCSNPGIRVQ